MAAFMSFQDILHSEITGVCLRLIQEYERRHGDKAMLRSMAEEAGIYGGVASSNMSSVGSFRRARMRGTHSRQNSQEALPRFSSVGGDVGGRRGSSGLPSREASKEDLSSFASFSGLENRGSGVPAAPAPGRARGTAKCAPVEDQLRVRTKRLAKGLSGVSGISEDFDTVSEPEFLDAKVHQFSPRLPDSPESSYASGALMRGATSGPLRAVTPVPEDLLLIDVDVEMERSEGLGKAWSRNHSNEQKDQPRNHSGDQRALSASPGSPPTSTAVAAAPVSYAALTVAAACLPTAASATASNGAGPSLQQSSGPDRILILESDPLSSDRNGTPIFTTSASKDASVSVTIVDEHERQKTESRPESRPESRRTSHQGSRELSQAGSRDWGSDQESDDTRNLEKASTVPVPHRASICTWEAPELKKGASEKWLIDPRWRWYRIWVHFMSCVVVFSTFFTPYRYGFMSDDNEIVAFLDGVIDALFGVDILLRFNTALQKTTALVVDRKAIARDYMLSAAFWIDILATVPIDVLWEELAQVMNFGSDETVQQVAATLGLLRLLRINRILILCRALQQNTRFNLLGVVIGKFLLFILLCTHISGCIFYGLARVSGFEADTWIGMNFEELPDAGRGSQYVHALFWAFGTFKAGPVSGQLGPVSDGEMIMACMAMLVNICLQTYLVSSMAALLTSADVNIYAFRNRLRQLSAYAERKRLPDNVRDQIAAYLRFRYATNEDLENTVLGTLPELFRQRVSHALYEDMIENIIIFARPKKCTIAFLWQIHGALVPTSYMPHHDFVHQEEPAASMHILADGEVQLHYHEDMIELRHSGEELTAIPFICKITQPFGVRTTRVCSVLSIDHASWDAIALAAPEDNARVNANLLKYCQRKQRAFQAGTVGFEMYNILSHAVQRHLLHHQQTIVSTLCYAAARGDTSEINKYLVGGTADCADYDARSPLHIAAANGQVSAVELLIRKEANVNAVDNFGRTPLLEACRSRQLPAARELMRHGASLGFTEAIQLSQQVTRLSRSESRPSASVMLTFSQIRNAEASELCSAAADPQQLWYLKALVEFGADVNASDYDSRCALHVAAASGNKPAVEHLLRQDNIDVDLRDNFGRTPLMEAVRHNQEPCARLLQAHNATHGMVDNRVLHEDDSDEDAGNAIHAGQELCQAAFSNNRRYLTALVEYCGIDVDTPDYDLRTALMLACAEGNTEVATELVHHGADVHRKDRWGHTPVSEARHHGHDDLAQLLEHLGKVRFDLQI